MPILPSTRILIDLELRDFQRVKIEYAGDALEITITGVTAEQIALILDRFDALGGEAYFGVGDLNVSEGYVNEEDIVVVPEVEVIEIETDPLPDAPELVQIVEDYEGFPPLDVVYGGGVAGLILNINDGS